jgi:nucleoside-diphosphate-sugar epimerase
MRVLVLGGTGFVGSAVVEELVAHGHDVSVFHRGVTAARAGVRQIQGNRNDLAACADDLRRAAPEVVVDAIAATGAQSRELVETFRGAARRTVVLSSGDVYLAYDILHGRHPGPVQPTPITEAAPLRESRYPYRGAAIPDMSWVDPAFYDKIEVEREAMSEPSLPSTILRLPMVYGPGDLTGIRRRFEAWRKPMDDGTAEIQLSRAMAEWHAPWGHTENIADAVVLAVENECAAGQIYNVCDPDRLTVAELAGEIAAVVGWFGRIALTDASEQLKLAQHLDMDSTKIREELGYAERVPRGEALRRTIEWERAHPTTALPAPPDTARRHERCG